MCAHTVRAIHESPLRELSLQFGEVVDSEMKMNQFGEIVRECWEEIPEKYQNVEMDEFVVMPNHFHDIIIINESKMNDGDVGAIHELPLRTDDMVQRRRMLLPKIIGRFKMNSAKRINEIRDYPGESVWQRNYYEHIIRDEDELIRIREYIYNNPKRWPRDEEYI